MPLGLMCDDEISEPTVVEPSGSESATARIAAFSIAASIHGVAKTFRSPEPAERAVFCSVTVTLTVHDNPFSNILTIIIGFLPFLFAKIGIFARNPENFG